MSDALRRKVIRQLFCMDSLTYHGLRGRLVRAKKKQFNVVKHVKSLSRAAVKAPKAQIVRSKKKELLDKIAEKEGRERQ
jgi:hypothetical protein